MKMEIGREKTIIGGSKMGRTEDLLPMLDEYKNLLNRLRKDIPDALLLFRVGDFYEIFFDEAYKASKVTGLDLDEFNFIPMVGIPYHAVLDYIPTLLDAGFTIVTTEQIEDRTQKGWPLRREVKEIIR